MTDVAEHFVLLSGEAGGLSDTQLWTRLVGLSLGSDDVMLALDSDRGRHLLIPSRGRPIASDSTSQGVSLGKRVLEVDGAEVDFIDLHCRIASLNLVFEHLVGDLLGRLRAEPEDPMATSLKVLGEWRDLLRTASEPVSRETVIGLFGELEVLGRLGGGDMAAALDTWRGPDASVHDFVSGSSELEVKTTASVGGNFVAVSNIDQLDPAMVRELHLAVIHVREDGAGESLDDRVRLLLDSGAPRDTLLKKVAAAGYVFESGHDGGLRLTTRSVRFWRVGESFPGLRRAEIGHDRLRGVSKIRYELAVDSAPKPLNDEQVSIFTEAWVASDG